MASCLLGSRDRFLAVFLVSLLGHAAGVGLFIGGLVGETFFLPVFSVSLWVDKNRYVKANYWKYYSMALYWKITDP